MSRRAGLFRCARRASQRAAGLSTRSAAGLLLLAGAAWGAQPAIEVIEQPAPRPTPGGLGADPAREPAAAGDGLSAAGDPALRLARRVVRAFDFEERAINELRVPLYWHVAQHNPPERDRPGFPVWNRPSLDYTVAAAGEGSVRLPIRGGSVSLRLDPGAISVFEGGDYRVGAKIRTRGLERARACLSARLLDQAGEPLPASEVRSRLIGDTEEGGWTLVEIDVLGLDPRAAFLQIDLEVLQPEHAATAGTPPEALRLADQEGAAWFDDVTIRQIARVELSAHADAGLFTGDEPPVVHALVRDMTGERLTARLRVRDLDGRIVSEWSRALGAQGLTRDFPLDLPAYGWYAAELEVFDRTGSIGKSEQSVGWLAPDPRERGVEVAGAGVEGDPPVVLMNHVRLAGPKFGLAIDDARAQVRAALPAIVAAVGLDLVDVSLWDERGRAHDDADSIDGLRTMTNTVRDLGSEVSLAYRELPALVAAGADAEARSVARTVLAQGSVWDGRIDPVLERFGQSVRRWSFAGEWSPETARELADRLSKLVPAAEPVLEAALWDLAGDADRAPRDARLSVRLAPGASERQIREAFGAGDPTRRAPLRVEVEMARDRSRGAFDDALRRAVLAWEALARDDRRHATGELVLVEPWRWLGGRRPRLDARPELVAWRTLAEALRGRRPIARIWAGERTTAILLEGGSPDDRGMIIAWTDHLQSGAGDGVSLDMRMAPEGVRVIDAFGNERAIALSSGADGPPVHRVALGSTPVLIEGVDPRLVLLQQGMSLDDPTLPTANRTLERTLTFANPFPHSAELRYFIVEPGEGGRAERGWDIEPRSGRVQIEPGATVSVPITLAMSPLELSGWRDLVVHAEVRAGQELGVVELRTPMMLGDPRLIVDAHPFPASGGGDLVVEVSIANDSDAVRALEVTVVGASDRRRTTLSALPPGEQAVRRFVLAGDAASERVFVSIEDLDTGERVNQLIDVP